MISVQHLTKRYGDLLAVDDVTFDVEAGTVVGFLGPNGAGKSTTMRMMTSLTPPTSGRATISGLTYRELPNPARQVGVMLDAAAQHAGRSGREVLALTALQIGMPKSRVEEMLGLVGLTDKEAGRRVGAYSLGMRQRLGLAVALMGEPEVLILDEPANGLDPHGIAWMRGLLRNHADAGGTVLLSSHLLHEVEVVADRLVVIGRGRIVAEGTSTELLGGAATLVRSLDDTALVTALAAAGLEVTQTGAGLRVTAGPEQVGRIALDTRIVLTDLRPAQSAGLEELFLHLTANDSRDGAVA